MAHIIGRGRQARETYPEPKASGAGALVRAGFDNSTEDVIYPLNTTTPILRDANTALQIPLTGFRPGNLILIQFSVTGEDAVGSGPISATMLLTPSVDLGAGARFLDLQSPQAFFTVPTTITFVAFVRPVPVEVLADPVIGLSGSFFAPDATRIKSRGALLVAEEIAESSITQMPTILLLP
jgi:hypothetical protein